jgi:ketosteroid isomerase-like protein
MAKQDVELVRSAIEAFNRRDLKTLSQLMHDDFEFVSVLTAVDAEGATYRGSDAWTGGPEAVADALLHGP